MDNFTLELAIKTHILMVWNRYYKNTSRAARALGIGRTTMYRKLKEYGEETNKKERS